MAWGKPPGVHPGCEVMNDAKNGMWETIKASSIRIKTVLIAKLDFINQEMVAYFTKAKTSITIWSAKAWQFAYRTRNWILTLKGKYGGGVSVILLLLLIVGSGFLVPVLQNATEPYFSEQSRFDGFQTLLVTLGGALIGATAIAFSLIMFAMQVSVERMPHGLFRKFSSDSKLLGTFAVTFVLAILITSLSLIPDKTWVVVAALITAWSSVLIIVFFLLAYRRALSLISPTKQLAFIVTDTKKNLNAWGRAAYRAAPLLRCQYAGDKSLRANHDRERAKYFQLNGDWTLVAEQAIAHCVSFARRYIEQGDHEVSHTALNAIVAINAVYVKTKGRTFVSDNYLFDNPFASDAFITNTLEHLRQNVQIGLSRGDEQQIEQTFRAIAQLCHAYLHIDYGDEHATRSHAYLASGYLSSAVEAVMPHSMADVLIEGVTLMGNVAQLILRHKEPQHVTTISEKITEIACAGAVNKKYQAVTRVAVMQLAKLTFELMRSDAHNVKYAIGQVRSHVEFIAKLYLKIPDTSYSSIHSKALGPYYSGSSANTLIVWLSDLANAISQAEADDESAQRIISHIRDWAYELPRTEKELFLLAIDKQSHLAFDINHWIVEVTKLLLAVSNAGACGDDNRDEIRTSARRLISVLSWVPDAEGTVRFVENYQFTENLFDAAVDAKQRGCDDVAVMIRELLLSWAFKVGKYKTVWGAFERACCGLACLNIIFDLDDSVILDAIQEWVGKGDAPNLEIRRRSAARIIEGVDEYPDKGYEYRAIQSAMTQVDQGKLRTLLTAIADQLIPEVVEERGDQK